ncbi:hypothetical protein [Nitrosopumilus ureiphilus]|uniref:Uncharacterized protein n=1 Tax=Nitrosopumilus ureiphilus TaxID=1470067 RepID=A0A7D5RAJ6_9ARCH|nr:hypothetical protein [Nitrosopumilus ureiphilus]QLH06504.1 hypothetical protein C5F50_05025 [Nitrosopumilus ureiphilus]
MKNKFLITVIVPIAIMSVAGAVIFGLGAASYNFDREMTDEKKHPGSALFIPVDYDKTDLELFADYFCPNNNLSENDTGVFMTCLHPDNKNGIIFELPSPSYKLELCKGTYGCIAPYVWAPQIPSNLVSEEQEQEVVNKVLQLPEAEDWPSEPELDNFLIMSSEDDWHASVQFFIDGVKMPQHNKCEYYDSATVDLETLEILNGFRYFDDFEYCENQ